MAALHLLALDPVERDRRALAGARLLHGDAVHLHAPHAHGSRGGHELHRVAWPHAAAPQRAGHHRTETLDGEHAVHGQSSGLLHRSVREPAKLAVESREQLRRPRACGRREFHHGRIRERRAGQQRTRVARHHLGPRGLDQIALGEHHDAARDAEQLHDREVLAGLRHHAFVGCDHEQHEVDAAHARQHVLDEALVPRHVHDAGVHAAGGQERGEAEIDRDAAPLLLGEAVGVNARQPSHERGLAVIDVAGGADHGQSRGDRSLGWHGERILEDARQSRRGRRPRPLRGRPPKAAPRKRSPS